MIIDEEAFNNSNFSLMSDDEFDTYSNNDTTLNILKKYKLVSSSIDNSQYQETNYILLNNYIDELYLSNKNIPDDIQLELLANNSYKNYIVQNTQKRLSSIITNSSTIFFKEIVSIINLLSLGQNFKIFINYNNYDFNAIADLFRWYENTLREQFENDKELFESTFHCYLQLIFAYNQLCIINSTDLQRKKTITPTINLITETINILKFTIALDMAYIDQLNNALGEILFYFSHLPYIETKNKELEYLIDEYYLLLEKQTDGYNLSKDTDFGGNNHNQQKEFSIFLNNSAYLFLTMIQKLQREFPQKDFFSTYSFKKCLVLFSNNFPIMGIDYENETLENFKQTLLNALVQNYIISSTSFVNVLNYKNVINDFIQTSDHFDIHNIETIHDILLFAQDIEDFKYLYIADNLIQSELIKNDYYEFFKLKTIDIIINYFIHNNNSTEDISLFIQKVLDYIEENKQASHLLSMFSKIYLSITHYYAMKDDAKCILKAKDLYAIYINMNGLDALKNEYKFINEQILHSLGKYYVLDLNLELDSFNKEKFISLGKKFTTDYLKHKELSTKYEINKIFTHITSLIIEDKPYNIEELHSEICKVIAHDIFYGLCEVRVDGLTKIRSSIIDNGYKVFNIALLDEYKLQFIFPDVYDETFNYILENNHTFIKNNIKNILTSLSKKRISYTHKVTNLYNLDKIKLDLNTMSKEKVLFMCINIGSLNLIHENFGERVANNYLKTICSKIKQILPKNNHTYYLGQGNIGLILDKEINYELLIDIIQNFKIKKDNVIIDGKLTIVLNNNFTEVILDETQILLQKAIRTNKQVSIHIGEL